MRSLRLFLPFALLLPALATHAQTGAKQHLQVLGSDSASAVHPASGSAALSGGQAAPIPAPLRTAHSVFLANAGADAGLFPHPFSGAKSRVYDRFYSDIAASGVLSVVDTPASAELVLAVELLGPSGSPGADKTKGYADPLPEVRLTAIDRATGVVVWSLTETVEAANLQKTHDANLDRAVDAAVAELLALHKLP